MKPIELFKAGTQTSNSGVKKEWTVDRLEAIANNYNEAVAAQGDTAKFPIVIGHPKDNDQAYGWFKSLSVDKERGVLLGEPEQVDESIRDAVASGKYKKGSISFYTADSEASPAKGSGIEFPRHFGLLGAMAPAVKGLAAVSFSDAGEDVLEFSADEDEVSPGLLRRIWTIVREAVAADKTTEKVEPVVEAPATETTTPETPAATAETTPSANVATQVENTNFAEAEARLAAREAELAARETELRNKENESFCESLIANGARILPAQRDKVLGLLNALSATSDVVEFAEGEESTADALKSILSGLPKHVEFGEVAADEPNAGPKTVNFTVPEGYTVDPEQLAALGKVQAYQAANPGVSMAEAIKKTIS